MNEGFTPQPNLQRNQDVITNDGWFCDVSMVEFTRQYSIPADMDNDVILHALLIAMARINSTLSAFKNKHKNAGVTKLELVSADILNGENSKVLQYKRAIYSQAKADLIKENVSMARKADAANHASESGELISHYEQHTSQAIANIQGLKAIGVTLI
jgi:hypothetical protein